MARKITLYMKRFMLSLVCVMNPNHRLSIPQSPSNVGLTVACEGACIEKVASEKGGLVSSCRVLGKLGEVV